LRLVLVLDGKKPTPPVLLLPFNCLTYASDGETTEFDRFSTIQVALKPLRPLTPALHAHSLCADVKKRERAELFNHVTAPYWIEKSLVKGLLPIRAKRPIFMPLLAVATQGARGLSANTIYSHVAVVRLVNDLMLRSPTYRRRLSFDHMVRLFYLSNQLGFRPEKQRSYQKRSETPSKLCG